MNGTMKLSILNICLFANPDISHLMASPLEDTLMLANELDENVDLTSYWMSEKLDGIRAIWTGTQLLTRKGNVIHAPVWFTKQLPNQLLEGELWAGRGMFHIVQQTVLDGQPVDEAWRNIQYMLFDLPNSKQPYKTRYDELLELVKKANSDQLLAVKHHSINSNEDIQNRLNEVINTGGEGLMLRKTDVPYRHGRSSDLFKVKKHQDAEAVVIGYKQGKGKYQGKTGSVLVLLESGRQLYIGSGLTDEQRENPPPIGSVITFQYNGFTYKGLPRFPRIMRSATLK